MSCPYSVDLTAISVADPSTVTFRPIKQGYGNADMAATALELSYLHSC
jgi:hypothetical protein